MDRPEIDGVSPVNPDKIIQTAYRTLILAKSPIIFSSLTASRDAETVQRVIAEKYGFTPPINYCVDLILFVEALTDGQQ